MRVVCLWVPPCHRSYSALEPFQVLRFRSFIQHIDSALDGRHNNEQERQGPSRHLL